MHVGQGPRASGHIETAKDSAGGRDRDILLVPAVGTAAGLYLDDELVVIAACPRSRCPSPIRDRDQSEPAARGWWKTLPLHKVAGGIFNILATQALAAWPM